MLLLTDLAGDFLPPRSCRALLVRRIEQSGCLNSPPRAWKGFLSGTAPSRVQHGITSTFSAKYRVQLYREPDRMIWLRRSPDEGNICRDFGRIEQP